MSTASDILHAIQQRAERTISRELHAMMREILGMRTSLVLHDRTRADALLMTLDRLFDDRHPACGGTLRTESQRRQRAPRGGGTARAGLGGRVRTALRGNPRNRGHSRRALDRVHPADRPVRRHAAGLVLVHGLRDACLLSSGISAVSSRLPFADAAARPPGAPSPSQSPCRIRASQRGFGVCAAPDRTRPPCTDGHCVVYQARSSGLPILDRRRTRYVP